jgi:hypothetical protein
MNIGRYPPSGRALVESTPELHSSAIARTLAIRESTASNPSANARAASAFSRIASSPSKRRRKSSTLSSSASERTPSKSSAADVKSPCSRRRFPSSPHIHDSPPVSIAAVRASRSNAMVSSARPWMNSAPSSTGTAARVIGHDHTRPPMRSRASNTIIRNDRPAKLRAATKPAAPAPTTMTSTSMHGSIPVYDRAPALRPEVSVDTSAYTSSCSSAGPTPCCLY